MHGKDTMKAFFKVSFMLVQFGLFVVGIGLLISSLTLYIKVRKLFSVPARMFVYLAILCALLISTSMAGFKTISSKERWTIALYVILVLTLINMESLLIAKFPRLTEHVKKASKGFWERSGDGKRSALEERFSCCGFDRASAGAACEGRRPCITVFTRFAWGLRNVSEKILILLILSESLSAGLLCLLRLRK